MPAEWRAAVTILREGFPADEAVWECVTPGRHLDLNGHIGDQSRPMGDRVLLAAAQGFVDGATPIPWGYVVALSDGRMRLLLDALAIARGSLPVD